MTDLWPIIAFLVGSLIYLVYQRLNKPRRLLKEKEFREWRRLWARKDEEARVAKQRELARFITEEMGQPLVIDKNGTVVTNKELVERINALKRLAGWEW